jgi:pyruvate,water dikinase
VTPQTTGTTPQSDPHGRNRYLIPLTEVTRLDSTRVGHKAANLGELVRAGFPVPDGVVLTTAALDDLLARIDTNEDPTSEVIRQTPLPEAVMVELVAALRHFGDGLFAVRSSGTAEDLPGQSYAGQYETVLNVRDADGLIDAVKTCWSSAFSQRVATYRGQLRQAAPGMAVLIQRMVSAEASGVAFSANPITGDRDQVVINAVRGLGDRLVSGVASPDQWLVATDAVPETTPEHAIEAQQARAIADLARAVERTFGGPQDIEWAIAGGQLTLLQARPITALPPVAQPASVVPVEPPPGYWEREVSHFPKPLSPLYRSLKVPADNAGFSAVFEEFGFLVERLEIQEIGGWMYLRVVPFGGKDRKAPPKLLMPLLVRLVPDLRRRANRCLEVIRSQHHTELVRRWYGEWRGELAGRITELRNVERSALSDGELDTHFEQAATFFHDSHRLHFRLHGALILALGELAFTCRDLLSWDDAATLELLGGLSTTSTEPGRRLRELADYVRRSPQLQRLLADVNPSTRECLAALDPEFAEAFARFQKDFGCSALRLEVADPTLEEDPTLLLNLVRDQLERGADMQAAADMLAARRARAIDLARASLNRKSAFVRDRFDRVLAIAQHAYPVREDNERYTVSAPHALVRYAALELGERLARRGQIEQRDDVFFLEYEEVRAALRDGRERRTVVARRRAERRWIEQHPGPGSFGRNPGPPPSFDALRPELRLAMNALLWTIERVFAAERSAQPPTSSTDTIAGIAASTGSYTGPVRLVRSESEFEKIRPGDVLVCPVTSPVWSILFPQLGALVTDSGGLLSHPAIIAREYRIPAVVATGRGTARLRDGQIVTVDGDRGEVRIEPNGAQN